MADFTIESLPGAQPQSDFTIESLPEPAQPQKGFFGRMIDAISAPQSEKDAFNARDPRLAQAAQWKGTNPIDLGRQNEATAGLFLKGIPVVSAAIPQTEDMTKYEQESPMGAAAWKGAGRIVSTAPAMIAAPNLFGMGATQGLGARTVAGALSNGAIEGADTLANTGDVGKALNDAAKVGGTAAVMMPAFSALGSVAGWGLEKGTNAYSRIADALLSRGEAQPALSSLSAAAAPAEQSIPHGAGWAVAQNLMRDFRQNGMSREEAFDAAIEAMKSHQQATNFGQFGSADLPEAIADIGPNMQGLARSITSRPGEAQTIGNKFLGQRAGVDSENLVPETAMNLRSIDAAKRALEVPDANLRQSAQDLIAAQKKASDPAYQALRDNPQTFDVGPIIKQFEENNAHDLVGDTWSAFKNAADLYKGEGRVNSPITTIARFDAAKKQVGDLIQSAIRQGNNNQARILSNFQKQMVEGADLATAQTAGDVTSSPYYQARRIWEGPQKLLDASKEGFEALNPDRSFEAAITSTPFAKMTDPEQRMARIGLAQQIENKLGSKAYGEDSSRIFRQENTQKALADLFPEGRLGQFNTLQAREAAMQNTFQKAFKGSDTARILEGNADTDALSAFGHIVDAVMHPGTTVTKAMQWLKYVNGLSNNDKTNIANIIFKGNPEENIATLEALKSRYGDTFVSQLKDALQSRATSGLNTATAASDVAGSSDAQTWNGINNGTIDPAHIHPDVLARGMDSGQLHLSPAWMDALRHYRGSR